MTAVPAELLEPVIASVDPVEVWLFGSRARGEARPGSDWDLYVVVDDGAGEDAWTDAIRATNGFGLHHEVGVDVVVRPWSRSLVRRRTLGTLDEIVDHEGVRVYARGDAPPVLEAPPVNSPLEWLESGRKDVKIARLALDADIPDRAAFSVQQAWEKAIKGLRTLEGRRSWKTHKLQELVQELEARLETDVAFETISKWVVEGRYEGEGLGVPQEAQVRLALADAEAALNRLEAAL